MIEIILKKFLEDNLSVPVKKEENHQDVKYVLFEKTGSNESDFVKKATIAIQSYASSSFEACELNEQVKEVMKNMINLDEVMKCELNTDYEYNNIARKQYRYQAIFQITYF